MAISLSNSFQSASPMAFSVTLLASTSPRVLFKWPWCWLTSGQLAENMQQGGWMLIQELIWQHFWGLKLRINNPWYSLLGRSCDF